MLKQPRIISSVLHQSILSSVSFCTSIENLIDSLVSHSSLEKMSYLSDISYSLNTRLKHTSDPVQQSSTTSPLHVFYYVTSMVFNLILDWFIFCTSVELTKEIHFLINSYQSYYTSLELVFYLIKHFLVLPYIGQLIDQST